MGGAYAAQFQFFLGVSHLERISDSAREEARALALDTLFSNFNEINGFSVGAVFIRESGTMEFWDGNTTHLMLEQVPANLRLLHEPLNIKLSDPTNLRPEVYLYDHNPVNFTGQTGALNATLDRTFFNKMSITLRDDAFIAFDRLTSKSIRWPKPKKNENNALITFNTKWIHPNGPDEEHAYVRFTNGASIEIQSTYEAIDKAKKYLMPSPEMNKMIARYSFIGQAPEASPYAGQLMALDPKTGQLKFMPKGVLLPKANDEVQTEPTSLTEPIKQINAPVLWDDSLDTL